MLSRFTSSEFWPITISKTWLTPSRFETSMLQKPLLTLFLAFFHLFKIPDLIHLFLVKAVFSVICTYGLYIFIKFVIKKCNLNEDRNLMNIVAAFFVLSSPTFLNYFFSVRSDQIACVLFSMFLLYCEDKKMRPALVTLCLIPLFGVKEILFLLPGTFYFLATFKDRFFRNITIYSAGFAVCAIVWIIALNIPYLPYLFDAYEGTNYILRFDTFYYKHELFLVGASFLTSLYFFVTKQRQFYKESVLSIVCIVLLTSFPQSYYFYMASLLPFIYLPLFIIVLKANINRYVKVLALSIQILFVFYSKFNMQAFFLQSAFQQYKYIARASQFVTKHHFSYMDGIGILPQQNFYPCFVSPFDTVSNGACLSQEFTPKVIIMTGRLADLGERIFAKVQNQYTQIYPNLWVLNSSVTEEVKNETDLSIANFPLAIIIF